MRRGATILWAALATIAGAGLFLLKYQVQGEEQRLHHLQKQIVQTEEEIHVLKAEWSYLNEPTHLRELAERNLGMHPMKAAQLASIDSFALAEKRPDDAPPGNRIADGREQQAVTATAAAAAPVSTVPDDRRTRAEQPTVKTAKPAPKIAVLTRPTAKRVMPAPIKLAAKRAPPPHAKPATPAGYPAYTAYPTATPASSPGDVMVITSPALETR